MIQNFETISILYNVIRALYALCPVIKDLVKMPNDMKANMSFYSQKSEV